MNKHIKAVFIGGNEGIAKKWCDLCKRYARANEDGKFYCSSCGHKLDGPKLAEKITDTDIANPIIASRKGAKKQAKKQDYPPGAQVTAEKSYNPITEDWTDV